MNYRLGRLSITYYSEWLLYCFNTHVYRRWVLKDKYEGVGYEEPTPLDTVMMKKKGVNLTLISAVLSKTQLDFTQLNNPIF